MCPAVAGERVRCHAVRIVVIAEHYPWPAVDGIRQRLDHVIRGLAAVGEVELIALDRRSATERAAASPPEIPGLVGVVAVPAGPEPGFRQWLPDWLRGGPPRRLMEADWSGVARTFRERMSVPTAMDATDPRPPVDLVWYSHVDSWWPVRDIAPDVASVADFYDLVNLALRLRRSTPPRFPPGSEPSQRARIVARWAVSRGFDLVDERRWDRVQRDCAALVDRVTVCSELDRERSGLANVAVIGNGSSMPERVDIDRSALRSDAPTFLFVGALDYEPNSEAVEWFVRQVFPSVLARVPSARIRIVGRGSERVEWVAGQPGVDLVGAVDEISDELDRADVSIVPIRVGAGTRLKVVEALANRLPLVTTTIGCEGIEVTHDVDALIADDAQGFADACVRAATDPQLRQRLTEAGAQLFADRYDWAIIELQLGELARQAHAGRRP